MRGREDKERDVMMDVVRVTEAAALAAGRLMGNGDKELVDSYARCARNGN